MRRVGDGANRGLGREVGASLFRAGARKVYAAARDIASIADSRAIPVRLDVTSADDIAAAALRHEFELKVIGLLSMVTAFAPILERNGGGAIANMLSVVSWHVYPFNATYCASKHAALTLTDGMRMQLRGKGTTVTGVYAGFIDTDMAARVNGPKASPREVADRMLKGIRSGIDHVCADEYSQAVFRTMFSDPASVERDMRAAWGRGKHGPTKPAGKGKVLVRSHRYHRQGRRARRQYAPRG